MNGIKCNFIYKSRSWGYSYDPQKKTIRLNGIPWEKMDKLVERQKNFSIFPIAMKFLGLNGTSKFPFGLNFDAIGLQATIISTGGTTQFLQAVFLTQGHFS